MGSVTVDPQKVLEHPWVDATYAPVYIFEAPEVVLDHDLELLIQAQRDFIHRWQRPYAFVAFFHKVNAFNAKQRKRVAEFAKEMEPHEALYNKGQAYVLDSAFGRGVLAAMHWLSPPVYPWIVTDSKEYAISWAQQRLRNDMEMRLRDRHPYQREDR